MKPLTVQEIRQAVGGRALTAIPADAPAITAVCTDTRRMEPGSLFIAINGPRYNAHDYLPEAAKGGAIAALVEDPSTSAPCRRAYASLPNLLLIGVGNTRQAMGKLATYVRRQLRSKVIAVAGSNGKTTTKYLIHEVLERKFRGSISPKSYNNDIGVPLAIFPADPLQDYLVLEIGTNHPGEVAALSEMAAPDIAVITSIGAEHLEGLGDLAGVRREEASILKGLKPGGTLVVNGDDPQLLELVSAYPGQKITFGFSQRNELFATDVQCDENGVRFNLNGSRRQVFVPMLGRHTATNALAAIAVARKMTVTEETIIESLAEAHGPEMRLQLQKVNGVTLLNDAYNANPGSMKAALETVCALPARGRRVAVVGDMRELGKETERYHREAGEMVSACKLDVLVCVGKNAKLIAEAAQEAGMSRSAVRRFADAPAAAKGLPRWLKRGDLVLLKASRGIELEAVVRAISEKKAVARRKAS